MRDSSSPAAPRNDNLDGMFSNLPREKALVARIKALIENVEEAASLADVPGVKKLRGGGEFYRIRVGDYRVGLALEDDIVAFVRVLHRREVYRYFP